MATIHRSIGMGSDELLEHLLGPDRDKDGDETITAAHLAFYKQYWGRLRPLPGAVELMHTCAKRGLRVVLASSASDEELAALRSALDADDAIHTATSSSDADAGKPSPDILQAALDQSGLSRERVHFVGDSVWDAEAAKRTGVPFIGVTCGGTSEAELREAGAIEVWRDPADLLDQGSSVLLE
jgi:HAD superfamily hydrolase (TIGR01549 family)